MSAAMLVQRKVKCQLAMLVQRLLPGFLTHAGRALGVLQAFYKQSPSSYRQRPSRRVSNHCSGRTQHLYCWPKPQCLCQEPKHERDKCTQTTPWCLAVWNTAQASRQFRLHSVARYSGASYVYM